MMLLQNVTFIVIRIGLLIAVKLCFSFLFSFYHILLTLQNYNILLITLYLTLFDDL